MTHTPGPWTIKGPSEEIEYDPGGDYAIVAYDLLVIGEAYGHVGKDNHVDAEANARLIAAAEKEERHGQR